MLTVKICSKKKAPMSLPAMLEFCVPKYLEHRKVAAYTMLWHHKKSTNQAPPKSSQNLLLQFVRRWRCRNVPHRDQSLPHLLSGIQSHRCRCRCLRVLRGLQVQVLVPCVLLLVQPLLCDDTRMKERDKTLSASFSNSEPLLRKRNDNYISVLAAVNGW